MVRRRYSRRARESSGWGDKGGTQHLRWGDKGGRRQRGDTAFARLRVALRQLQVLCKLRRVCRSVAVWKHLHHRRRAAPFGSVSRTHKVLCPRKGLSSKRYGASHPVSVFVKPQRRAKSHGATKGGEGDKGGHGIGEVASCVATIACVLQIARPLLACCHQAAAPQWLQVRSPSDF